MELRPGEDEAELAAAEVVVDHLEVVDSDLGFVLGMPRAERFVPNRGAALSVLRRSPAPVGIQSS
jgi:hypothetical protein